MFLFNIGVAGVLVSANLVAIGVSGIGGRTGGACVVVVGDAPGAVAEGPFASSFRVAHENSEVGAVHVGDSSNPPACVVVVGDAPGAVGTEGDAPSAVGTEGVSPAEGPFASSFRVVVLVVITVFAVGTGCVVARAVGTGGNDGAAGVAHANSSPLLYWMRQRDRNFFN